MDLWCIKQELKIILEEKVEEDKLIKLINEGQKELCATMKYKLWGLNGNSPPDLRDDDNVSPIPKYYLPYLLLCILWKYYTSLNNHSFAKYIAFVRYYKARWDESKKDLLRLLQFTETRLEGFR